MYTLEPANGYMFGPSGRNMVVLWPKRPKLAGFVGTGAITGSSRDIERAREKRVGGDIPLIGGRWISCFLFFVI
jgi:hypothetical protein